MHSRFAALRVRVAHRDYERSQPREEQWLLIEWPKTEKEPTKYWLSNLPASISVRALVVTAKLRWRIERDYEELKQELGLGHFEGRNWRGFHHHASLCIAAYGFLVVERCLFPPRPTRHRCVQPTSNFAYPPCLPARSHGALPVRTERHNPRSIATLRRQIATHLARGLPRCPCCLRQLL
jgi:hypothetical protein